MPARRSVELKFKGSRDYLHGTDVYECAVDVLRQRWPAIDGRCRFAFHRMTRVPLSAIIDTFAVGVARPGNCVAEMHVTGGAAQASVWFVERGGDVGGRYPYDEEAVVRDCTIKGNRIALTSPPPSRTMVEIVVAMTKQLHNAVSLPQKGKWLFTRLDLKRLFDPADAPMLSVTLVSPARAAVTRSDIASGSQQLGSIYFSVGHA